MEDLTPVVIDLGKLKENKLDESFLLMFGWAIKKILKAMFGNVSIPVNLKGNPGDVKSFLGALGAERNYIRDFKSFGLNDPKTYRSKGALTSAVSGFERKTGIKWPFK
tara:strand:+ start:231 stop:554 length:324 start_codon:yes stop_codon:yes gene_type:complete